VLELTDSKVATESTVAIKERMAFSRSRRHRRFSSQHRTDQIASPGTGFGDMLARAPGRRSAAKLLSEDGTSDRGEYRQAVGATENTIHPALKLLEPVGQAIVGL
jgi:regulator of protease activity HflC (stomatin/prohibitin superfamily)